MTNESAVARVTAHYPPAEISPGEFEEFVTELLGSAQQFVTDLKITLHEKIEGIDGTYDFDATVRYTFAGMSFLLLVEAKRHKNPIKRELIQILYQKVQSVGGHKGVMFSTAPYQRGALEFARKHGIALATVTEGRFTYETKSWNKPPPLSREAAARLGFPTFVGHHYGIGSEPNSTSLTLLSPEYPEYVADLLFDCSIAEEM
ncbi:restriction endonuclease [Sphaerisporangium sp. NBC_01403]|uniref:restriction endonuclease n=1 Tax=Sphaerisporangium sp. NBC_01403 TaxID=2903599 RepID=UPI00324F9F52